MGIDATSFGLLAELSRDFRPEGRSLMLGRQNYLYHVERPQGWLARFSSGVDRFQTALDRSGIAGRAADLVQPDGFAEKALAALGFGTVEAMDVSDFEGAGLLWDLNQPVPADLHRQFGFIFDGGTIEHVFNAPVAFDSVFAMLRVGGRFVAATPFNGWPGHGIYQFGPELVWSYWHRVKACRVHRCIALSRDGQRRLPIPDPAATGGRSEWTERMDEFPAGPVYLWYDVEKTTDTPERQTAQQSDYVAQWNTRGATAVAGRDLEKVGP